MSKYSVLFNCEGLYRDRKEDFTPALDFAVLVGFIMSENPQQGAHTQMNYATPSKSTFQTQWICQNFHHRSS